ncbi:sialate O-acetylesterase [Rahnella aquatilis]|nr:sialate O-acetylesterase [Rahnella aquatilis]
MNNLYTNNEVPLLIMMGQSNTDGQGIKSDVPDMESFPFSQQVRIFQKSIVSGPKSGENHINDGYWEDYTGNNGMVVSPETGKVSTSCGPELATAYLWATQIYPEIHKPLHIIKCAIGGTLLANGTTDPDTNWSDTAGQIWELAHIYTIRPAITQLLCDGKKPRLIGIYWGQGEQDGTDTKWSSQYENNLRHLLDNMRNELGFSSAPVMIIGLSTCHDDRPAWVEVKLAQQKVADQVENTTFIIADGSDNIAPSNRYNNTAAGPGRVHYTAIGLASIAEKTFSYYRHPGVVYDQYVNDFELIANARPAYESINLTDSQMELAPEGGIFQKLSVKSNKGIIQSYTWVADDFPLRDKVDSIPTPRFRLKKFDDTEDQEIIFCMAHDGDSHTKPGFVIRGSYAPQGTVNGSYQSGILVTVRNGGRTLSVKLITKSGFPDQKGSPVDMPKSIINGQLVWYRIKIVKKTLTIDINNQDKFKNNPPFPSESDWSGIFSLENNDFPQSGHTWFTLFNGNTSSDHPYAAHFHMPVLLANKLNKQ